MNYKIIINRGSTYANEAGWNWTKRRDKLITAWTKATSQERMRKINIIINQLDARINGLAIIINSILLDQKKKNLESEDQYIMLECPGIDCKYNPLSVGIGIKLKNYIPDVLKCENCGRSMKTKEDIKIENMFFDMRLLTLDN